MAESTLDLHKQLPTAKMPHEQESIQRQITALVHELYVLTEREIRTVEGENPIAGR